MMKLSVVLALALASVVTSVSTAVTIATVSFTHSNLNGLAFGVVLALVGVSGILSVTAWVAGMVAAAGLHRWDWFVAIVLLGPPAALALGLARSQLLFRDLDVNTSITL